MFSDQLTVNGENFIGLLGFASDKYAVIAPQFKIDEILSVPTLKAKTYSTNLVGMFCNGNSNGILVPYFVSDEELDSIRGFAEQLGVEVERIEGRYTSLGNMIACNDKAAFIADSMRDYDTIADVLGVEVVSGNIGGHIEVGAYIAATNKGFLTHPDAEKQLDELKSILKVEGMTGTVNCGIPYVKAGLIANSKGYITGEKTTGIEMQRIEDALGFD